LVRKFDDSSSRQVQRDAVFGDDPGIPEHPFELGKQRRRDRQLKLSVAPAIEYLCAQRRMR
jgi:hypothetical protein